MSMMRVKRLIKIENYSLSLDKEFVLLSDNIDIINGFKTFKILKIDNKDNRIMVNGLVYIHITYKIKGMEGGRETFSMPLEFYHSFSIEEGEGEIYANIDGEIEKVIFNLRDNGKIHVWVGVILKIKIFKVEEICFLTREAVDFSGKGNLIGINEIFSLQDNQIIIEEYIPYDNIRPPAKKIVDVSGRMFILEKNICEKMVLLRGVVEFAFIYETIERDQPLASFNYLKEFNKMIETENPMEGEMVFVDFNNPKIGFEEMSNQGFAITSTSDIRVYISRAKVINLVNELPKSINDIKGIQTKNLLVESPLIQKIDRFHIDKIVYIQGPLVKEIVDGKCRHCYISSIVIKEHSIFIKGSLKVHIDYLDLEEENTIHQLESDFDFTKVLTIADNKKSINIEANAVIEEIRFDIVNQGAGIKVWADLKVFSKLTELVEKDILVWEL